MKKKIEEADRSGESAEKTESTNNKKEEEKETSAAAAASSKTTQEDNKQTPSSGGDADPNAEQQPQLQCPMKKPTADGATAATKSSIPVAIVLSAVTDFISMSYYYYF